MSRIAVAVLTAAVLVITGTPARACDPYWDWWCDRYDPYWDVPAYEVPWWEEPGYAVEPATEAWWTEPVVWIAPEPDPIPALDPAAEAAALGLHLVNEVFTGHVVTTTGDLTTYTSTSAAYDAGTAARVVATVATGESTAYDDLVLGGRTTLSDGRSVAGQIYENYVWNGYEWVVNAYVFFQDDAELARASEIVAPPAPASVAPIVEPVVAPPSAPAVQAAPAGPVASEPRSQDVALPPAEPSESDPAPAVTTPSPRTVRAGLALGPQADILGRIEVLRGRRIALWVRAAVDDAPARVIRWELRGGEVTMLGAVSGRGDEPLLASWRSLAPRGSTFVVTVRASVEVPGETPRDVDAAIEVVVRAPAVVE